jgi:nucleoid-associated protein YgaU
MGLIDFVVSAGQKLFGGAEAEAQAEAERGAALAGVVKKLGFEVEALKIDVKKDLATVFGKTPTQEMREKVILAVGNTAGIAAVDDRLEVVTPEPQAVYYTVKSGDSLSKIAKAQYGDAMKYPVIFEANKPMLTDPDKIYPGQVLRIPPQS